MISEERRQQPWSSTDDTRSNAMIFRPFLAQTSGCADLLFVRFFNYHVPSRLRCPTRRRGKRLRMDHRSAMRFSCYINELF